MMFDDDLNLDNLDVQAAFGDNLSVHYTGRLGGPEGKIFDTSRKGGDGDRDGGEDGDGCKRLVTIAGDSVVEMKIMKIMLTMMVTMKTMQEGAADAVQVSAGSESCDPGRNLIKIVTLRFLISAILI